MKTILYLIPYPRFFSQISNMGGHVAHFIGITTAFAKKGFSVHCLLEEAYEPIDGYGVSTHLLPMVGDGKLKRLAWGRSYVDKVEELVKVLGPDMVYMRYSIGFCNWMPSLKKRIGSVPLIVEVNSFLSQRLSSARFLERRFMASSDHIVTISETNRRQLLSAFGKSFSPVVEVVPNGVRLERFSAWRDNLKRPIGEPVHIAYAGLLKKHYGLECPIEACRKLRALGIPVVMHYFGDGPYRQELETLADGLSFVVFEGARSFESMPDILGSMDILLNAACPKNAFQSPTKIYEYMASGRPVVSARTQQTEQLLGNDERGLTYRMEDVDSLVDSIKNLVSGEDLATKLAGAARKFVASNCTWDQSLERVLSCLR